MDLEPSIHIGITYVRGLASVLQAIKAGSKQACSVKIDTAGMEVRWEDESKTLQSLVFLKPELFRQYTCPSVRKFGLQFSLLLDTLGVFASIPGNLEVSYPGPNGELVCEMRDESSGVTACTYARLSSLEVPPCCDLEDYWEEPASYFLTQGSQLKEVVEDLEWPSGAVEVLMSQQPPRLVLSAAGTAGKLEVELPTSEMSGFHCAGPEARFSYKYKSMRAAFCNLPNTKEFGSVSTKVTIDGNGMLKATHVISLQQGPAQQQQQQQQQQGTGGTAGSLLESQRVIDTARTATVIFMLLPLADT